MANNLGVPNRLEFVEKIRTVIEKNLLVLPLPKIHPSRVSGFSILTSLISILILNYSLVLFFVFVLITVLLDWLDGLIAKKYDLCSEKGYIADTASDRISEGIILLPFFMPWFYLFVLNNFLTVISFKRKKHIILPLRHIFLIFLALRVIV